MMLSALRKRLILSLLNGLSSVSAAFALPGGNREASLCASLVVVTRNRASYLNLLLSSLERQVLSRNLWEVIVVDCGSCDSTPDVLASFQKRLPLTTLGAERRSFLADAHSEAYDRSRGRIIILVADNQLVAPDFVARHVARHTGEPCQFVIGNGGQGIHTHLFSPDDSELTGVGASPVLEAADLDDVSKVKNLLCMRFADGAADTISWEKMDAGNLSFPRNTMLRASLDRRFGDPVLAHRELVYRLLSTGYRLCAEQDAISMTQFTPSISDEADGRVRDVARFFGKYPELYNPQLEASLLG